MTAISHSSGDLIADRRADYARMLDEAGDHAAAAEVMEQAMALVPDWPAGLALLATYRENAGDVAAAIATLKKLDGEDAEDVFAASLKLAVLGAAEPPAHPPGRYVEALFDSYADHFDQALTERLEYNAPERLAALLAGSEGETRRFRLCADLGCGTGLSGAAFCKRVARLEGFDLSANMLAKAEEKVVYHHLAQADLLLAPEESGLFAPGLERRRADLVVAADVLMYLGALDSLMDNVASLIAPGGIFLFSVEDGGDAETFTLLPSLRYAHAFAYVEGMLSRAGFDLKSHERAALRKDAGEPVPGILFLAVRRLA
ncbi:methyltransferase [Martelella soudanensis]|uniref:methyltransferase n=1 Tax=unclassified Martelella TaxID=2629616 RepID=UPI0015DD6440|nr:MULTISPECIES: methyltransferase [unclassified Martelella]